STPSPGEAAGTRKLLRYASPWTRVSGPLRRANNRAPKRSIRENTWEYTDRAGAGTSAATRSHASRRCRAYLSNSCGEPHHVATGNGPGSRRHQYECSAARVSTADSRASIVGTPASAMDWERVTGAVWVGDRSASTRQSSVAARQAGTTGGWDGTVKRWR